MKTFDQIEAKIKKLRNEEEEILNQVKANHFHKRFDNNYLHLKLSYLNEKISVLKWVLNM